MAVVARVRKRRKKGSGNQYFNEEALKTQIIPIIRLKGQLPVSFVNSIFQITDGMINSEFRNNVFVLENRDELKQECFFEVLKSLQKYDINKGRFFAYLNRIIKNTLLKLYYKHNRISTKEVKVFDLLRNLEVDDEMTSEEAFTLASSNTNTSPLIIKQNSNLFAKVFDTDTTRENAKKKKEQDEVAIILSMHVYIKEILSCLDRVISDETVNDYILRNVLLSGENDYLVEQGKQEYEGILYDAKYIFTECQRKLEAKMKEKNIEATEVDCDKVYISNKVLLYVKNKMSNRDIRSKCSYILANPKFATAVMIEVLAFFNMAV